MRIFANKSIWKKLVLIIIVITVISFAIPQQVQAADSIGGALMLPVCNLLVGLCDGVVNVIHKFTLSQTQTLIRISLTSGTLETVWSVFKGIVTIGAGVAITIAAIVFWEFSIGAAVVLGITTALTMGGVLSLGQLVAEEVRGAVGGDCGDRSDWSR